MLTFRAIGIGAEEVRVEHSPAVGLLGTGAEFATFVPPARSLVSDQRHDAGAAAVRTRIHGGDLPAATNMHNRECHISVGNRSGPPARDDHPPGLWTGNSKVSLFLRRTHRCSVACTHVRLVSWSRS